MLGEDRVCTERMTVDVPSSLETLSIGYFDARNFEILQHGIQQSIVHRNQLAFQQ